MREDVFMTKALDICPGQFVDIIGKTMIFDLRPEKYKTGSFWYACYPNYMQSFILKRNI